MAECSSRVYCSTESIFSVYAPRLYHQLKRGRSNRISQFIIITYKGRAINIDLAVKFNRKVDNIKNQRRLLSYQLQLERIRSERDDTAPDQQSTSPISNHEGQEVFFLDPSPNHEQEIFVNGPPDSPSPDVSPNSDLAKSSPSRCQ